MNSEESYMLKRPYCVHSTPNPNAEGWWDAETCAAVPLPGTNYCVAHLPTNFRLFVPRQVQP